LPLRGLVSESPLFKVVASVNNSVHVHKTKDSRVEALLLERPDWLTPLLPLQEEVGLVPLHEPFAPDP
jgi:hypothetical protein